MPVVRKKEIDKRLNDIRGRYEEDLVRLKDPPINSDRVLDLGCAGGNEAFAIMWFLDAKVVVGVDRDTASAQTNLLEFKQDVDETLQALEFIHASDELHDWWETEVPSFLREGRFPTFVRADIASKAEFGRSTFNEPFNLAYCSSLLCHVHRNQGPRAVQYAIRHISHVLLPGGFLIANEPPDEDLEYLEHELSKSGFRVTRRSPYGRMEYHCLLY